MGSLWIAYWDACATIATCRCSAYWRRSGVISADTIPSAESNINECMRLNSSLTGVQHDIICLNSQVKDIRHLKRSLQSLGIGTYVRPTESNPYHPILTARMNTTVFDVVHLFSEQGISAVPIIDDEGIVINLYETVDVIVSILLYCYLSTR